VLTETLTPGGPVHWGVMLAQGWKRELSHLKPPEAWAAARAWASSAERLGFHGLWAFDHFEPYPVRDQSPVLEAWTTLAAHAQATGNIVIGTLVSCAGYRNARLTMKMTETMTLLCEGRFCLGMGAGWDRYEFELLGMPFPTAAQRSDQLAAGLRAFRETWPQHPGGTPRRSENDPGRGPLLLVGGEGAKRTLPAAAAHADLTNWQIGVTAFARKSRVLSEFCEAIGRDPCGIRRTHAPNFQLFDSARAFRQWRQSEDRGMSASEVDAYIRNRGAFYGTAEAIREIAEEFIAAGCGGFMIFCNESPSPHALEQLASVRDSLQHA
jgi:alkanesulfonate monooxygenase SsuD/methylene tetrahydromethanopterin reductase-like flavin-dependent oxidoreductase (luciferase family)